MTLPEITTTKTERIEALREARTILDGTGGGLKTIFNGNNARRGGNEYPNSLELFRVADYINTGHDYLDTHADTTDKERP